MSPQEPQFNQGIWKELEKAIRALNDNDDIYETYVICGPIFNFDVPVKIIGAEDGNGVSLPVPNSYFKSVLTENSHGTIRMWSFIMANEESDKQLKDFLVPTTLVETMTGIQLWDRLVGEKIEREKRRIRGIWDH